jgi:hypothetical protein
VGVTSTDRASSRVWPHLSFYRAFVWVAPVVAFLVTRRVCRELQRSDAIQAERERAEHEAEQAAGPGGAATQATASDA